MISFHKEPQSAAFPPVSLSAILWLCYLHRKDGIRTEEDEEGERGSGRRGD